VFGGHWRATELAVAWSTLDRRRRPACRVDNTADVLSLSPHLKLL